MGVFKKNMKILFVITGLGGGGAEKVVVELAEQMFMRGHQVKIAYLKGDVIVQPKYKEIELIYLGFENLKTIYAAYNNYKELIACFKPDVVHAHMVHANIFARVIRKFQPIPKLICTAHSNNEGGKLRMLAYKLTHSMTDLTTNVSQSACKNFEVLGAVPLGGIQTIYNGINLSKFEKVSNSFNDLRQQLSLGQTSPIYIAIGRFHDAKDYPNLLNAFSLLKKTSIFKEKHPKLLIVGDGELRLQLEVLISHLDLDNHVKLLGRRDDITQLLNIANYFILSSKYEGLPTVVMEAMACETYVIATDCGGSKEIMGETGKLVPIQDSVALAEAMEQALYLGEAEVAKNNCDARLRVEEKFSLESSVQNWLKIYAA